MTVNKQLQTTRITKLIHGGQGLGLLEDGRKALVWGVLPGEEIVFHVTKKRRDYVEGIAQDIISASGNRISPKDPGYLSTSPWQVMDEKLEDSYKRDILKETYERAGVEYSGEYVINPTDTFYGYRNKMEYSFYGDETGLHLALYNRGTHAKQAVSGSSIARFEIDETARKITAILGEKNIRAGDLKTLILRCSQDGQVVAALFVKDEKFLKIDELDGVCKGLAVVYSNPKSPASVRTKELYIFGDISLQDSVAGRKITYDVFSFFQVNVPVFERAVRSIAEMVGAIPAIDMYSGVGSIGVSIPSVEALIENDEGNIAWARKNAQQRENLDVIHASSEKTLDLIRGNSALVVDPPRAGLHADLVERIKLEKPPKIIYLSCNPSTQARDIAMLLPVYRVEKVELFNFFPRTPHIESLALLVRQ